MDNNYYFEECKKCIDRQHNNESIYCLANRLSLAFNKACIELPIISTFVNEYHCKAFEEDNHVS